MSRPARQSRPACLIPPRLFVPTRHDTDEGPVPSVSRQQKPPSRPKTVRDTDDMGHWSVSRRNKEKVWVQTPVLSNRCTFYVSFPQRIRIFGSRITDSF